MGKPLSRAERNRRRVRQWQRDNPEKVNAKQREWYAKNLEKARAQSAARSRKYTKKYPDRVRASSKKRYQKYAERLRQESKAYRQAHPERMKVYKNRRRALKRGQPSYTEREWLDLLDYYEGRCLACRTTEDITADHVIPLSKGGAGTIDNIQPLCRRCNCEKRTDTTDWRDDGQKARYQLEPNRREGSPNRRSGKVRTIHGTTDSL